MFCALNGHELLASTGDAFSAMLAVAAGDIDEQGLAAWIAARITELK